MEKKTPQEMLEDIMKKLENPDPDKQCMDLFENKTVAKSVASGREQKESAKVQLNFRLSEKAYLKIAAAILAVVMATSIITIAVKEINYNLALNDALINSPISSSITAMIDEGREASPNLKYAELINVDFNIESTWNVASYIKEHPEEREYAIYSAYKRYKSESSFDDAALRNCMDRLMRELKESTKDTDSPFNHDTFASYVSSLGFVNNKGEVEYKTYDKSVGKNFIEDYKAVKGLNEIQDGGLKQ